MISEQLVRHMAGPISISAGTRDAGLAPHFTRCFGIRADPAAGTATLLVPVATSAALVADLRQNGRIAVNLGDVTNFHTRQVKGTLIAIADAEEADRAVVEANVAQIRDALEPMFGPGLAGGWARLRRWPALAVTFRVSEVFQQTPGAGTGGLAS